MKRLGNIGETRRWSNDASLKNVFGLFNNPTGVLFMEVITTLNAVLVADHMQTPVKAKVKGYIDNLPKFETILTAQVYLKVFFHTTTLSKCLQTVQLDLLSGHRMVDKLLENMQMLWDDFQACRDAVAKFVQWANEQLDEMDVDLVMEESLPKKTAKTAQTY